MSTIKLNRLILSDIWQHKFLLVLIWCCLGSALAVVEFTHMNRQLTMHRRQNYCNNATPWKWSGAIYWWSNGLCLNTAGWKSWQRPN